MPTPTVQRWIGDGTHGVGEEALILDFPVECEDALLRCLRALIVSEVTSWSRPMACPGDPEGRRVIYGYTQSGTGCTLTTLQVCR